MLDSQCARLRRCVQTFPRGGQATMRRSTAIHWTSRSVCAGVLMAVAALSARQTGAQEFGFAAVAVSPSTPYSSGACEDVRRPLTVDFEMQQIEDGRLVSSIAEEYI